VKPTWEQLNAYVDGELDAMETADVAVAIAQHADLAAQVAGLAKLKAVVRESRSTVGVLPLPMIRRFTYVPRIVAAALILAVTTVGTWWIMQRAAPNPTWIHSAIAAYEGWTENSVLADLSNGVRIAISAGETRRTPDLTAAKLKLVYVSFMPDGGRSSGVFLGYRGIHGCQVGLWIGKAPPGVAETIVPITSGALTINTWRVAGMGYVLLTHAMDADRIVLLANAVARITREDDRLDERVRTALQHTAEVGVPCTS